MAIRLSDQIVRRLTVGIDASYTNQPNGDYDLYVKGNTLHNGIIYLANAKTYYIDNSAIAYLNDLRVDQMRLVDNWVGFYSANNAGGSRRGYIQADGTYMYFRKENGNSGFNFNGNLVPSSANGADIGTSSLYWNEVFGYWLRANVPGSSTDGGITLYSTSADYAIMFRGTGNRGKWGDVQSDWATYFTMNAVNQRGWVWQGGGTNEANMSAALSSRGVFAARAVGNNAGYISFPQNGSYYTNTATITGALKITLPRYQTNTMMSFDVNIFTYDEEDSNIVTYRIGGYEYGATGWHGPVSKAVSWGKGDKLNLKVRFAVDGSKPCIFIGETNTTWKYPQVSVTNITYGYSDVAISSWGYGWSVSFVTTLPSAANTPATIENPAIRNDGTANRIAYYKTAYSIASGSIITDGSYLRNVGGYNNTSYAISTASFISNDWVRTNGSTGWYSQDHGGGWYMSDNTWIRSYGSKSIYQNAGTLRTDGDFWADYVHIDDNWLGVYNTKGNTSSTRFGYMQIDRSENGVWRFVKENGAQGRFDFNRSVNIIYDSSNSTNDALLYVQCQTANDWVAKFVTGSTNAGVYISGTGNSLLHVGRANSDNNTRPTLLVNNAEVLAYYPVSIYSVSTSRATLRLRTVADQPNDFWMGANGADKWSLTTRASNESYRLGLYSNVNSNYAFQIFHGATPDIATGTGYIDFNYAFNMYPRYWGTAPTRAMGTIRFPDKDHAHLTSGNYYRPWFSGSESVTSRGYGNAWSVGLYTTGDDLTAANVGFYLGTAWDGNATTDKVWRFARGGNTTVPGSIIPVVANTHHLGTSSLYWSNIYGQWVRANVKAAGDDGGVTLYGTSVEYSIMFRTTANQGKHGDIDADWATYFMMNNQDGRGWAFKRWGGSIVASISTSGTITGQTIASSWIDGQKINRRPAFHATDASDNGSFWPWFAARNTNTSKLLTFGNLGNNVYLISSAISRTSNGYDRGLIWSMADGHLWIEGGTYHQMIQLNTTNSECSIAYNGKSGETNWVVGVHGGNFGWWNSTYWLMDLTPRGTLWLGRSNADGVERQIGITNASHNLYLYVTNTGARGLYSAQGGRIVEVDTNSASNRVYFADSYNHNRTSLAYSQAAIKMYKANIQDSNINTSVIYYTAWNGYELRAVSQNYLMQRYDWWTSGNGRKVDNLRGGVTFAYTNHGSPPTTGTIVAFDCASNENYTLQLMGSYGGIRLYFRNRNGDNGTWQSWRQVLTTAANTATGDANNPIYINADGAAVVTNRKMGAKSANGYWGIASPDNADNVWIRTTTLGFIPYQSGAKNAGHQSLGTSSWYFAESYVTTTYAQTAHVYGNLYVSKDNTTGNGIYLADDGSIVDLNDGYCSMRFSYGVSVTNGKDANTHRIRLRNTGCIETQAAEGNYAEGLRIYQYSNWSTILLGGAGLGMGSRGTNANSWSIHNNNGTFYISKNGSSSSGNAHLAAGSNYWTFYTRNNWKLDIDGSHVRAKAQDAGAEAWTGAAIEIREVNEVVANQSAYTYSPRIGFHWGNRCAGTWGLESDNIFTARNQGGGSYKGIRVGAGYFYDTITVYAGNINGTVRITARTDGWIYMYNSGNGIYWPNCNGAHVCGNVYTSYAPVCVRGSRGGYGGLQLGENTNYSTLMDNTNDKGWYQQSNGRWAFYYQRSNDYVALWGTSYSGWKINLCTNTYCYGAFYSGDIRGNCVRLVDNWVGFYQSANAGGARYGYIQCNANRMYFRKENGVNGNLHFDFAGNIYCSGEFVSGTYNGVRIRNVILRNDGSNFYFLVGSNVTPGDNWNGLRPFYFNLGNGYSYHTRAYQAVWNDYAEFRKGDTVEPGRCVVETSSGVMTLSTERLQPGAKMISDTYGEAMGETKEAKTPIAVSGRMLAYPYRDRSEYQLGAAVCSAPNGTIDIMTREEIMMYPERIVGTVSEIPDYEIWHSGGSVETGPIEDIQVNGRIWIYVR